MTCEAREFFRRFSEELKKQDIPCELISSGHELPGEIACAVPGPAITRLRFMLIPLARQNGWALVQTLPQADATRFVLVNLENPAEILQLNVSASDAPAPHFCLVQLLRKCLRFFQRLFQPAGLQLTVMGSDGAGKSTLLARMQTMLQPCFPSQKTLHFRPKIFGKRTKDDAASIANPHGRAPASAFTSRLRIIYYFADHWAGWFVFSIPLRLRGALLIYDRSFDDLLMDERRYRLQRTGPLVRLLRRLLPPSDLTFLLIAPAEVLHQRKPELPVAELARQQEFLRQLASENVNYLVIPVDQPPEAVACDVCRQVAAHLAVREENRI